jgi:hypothetical protein
MGHEVRPCSAAIGLGSHDLGVATTAADLYRAGFFPVLVFSGGNSPTTRARFPRGEAVHVPKLLRRAAEAVAPPAGGVLVVPGGVADDLGKLLTQAEVALGQSLAGFPIPAVRSTCFRGWRRRCCSLPP